MQDGQEIFNIKVFSSRKISFNLVEERTELVPIVFRIFKHAYTKSKYFYTVMCYIDNYVFRRGIFKSSIAAHNFLRQDMKHAMHNKLTIRFCDICDSNIYYPNTQCENCEQMGF